MSGVPNDRLCILPVPWFRHGTWLVQRFPRTVVIFEPDAKRVTGMGKKNRKVKHGLVNAYRLLVCRDRFHFLFTRHQFSKGTLGWKVIPSISVLYGDAHL